MSATINQLISNQTFRNVGQIYVSVPILVHVY
eukprot:UN03720